MSQVSSTKRLVSASAVMASGTLISRVLGVVRVALLAFILGTATRQADIYGLADMVPNSLYILFAGGALNTVLVPQIVRAIKKDEDGGEAYTNRIMTAFMLIITAVAVLVTIGAPVVARIYTSGSWRDPGLAAQYGSLIALMFLTLPQIFFYGAFFLLGQILNARDKFGPMMWAPIANNVVAIIVLSTYLVVWGNQQDHSQAFTTPQILLLGIGSTAGIAVQTLVLLPYVRKVGFKLRPRFDLKGTGLGHTFSLTKWTIGFVAVNQLALVVVQRLATSATATGEGAGVVAYANAHLLWILPHSLITVSLATAMLPSASRLAASGDTDGVSQEFMKTVRLALIVIVPAAVVFLALAQPTTGILFGQGAGRSSSDLVAWALMAFALGLIPFTVQFVTLRTFYALEDTRTPFLVQVLIAGLNMVGAIGLVSAAQAWMDEPSSWVATALALAYSVAYLAGVLVSWRLLKRRVPGIDGGAIGMHILRLLLASAVGGVPAYFLAGWLTRLIDSQFLGNVVALALGGLLILGSFVGIGKLLKVRELTSLSTLLSSRFGRRGPATPGAQPATDAPHGDRDDSAARDDEALVMTAITGPLDFDSGPPTVIRNRPPIVQRTFDAHPAWPVDNEVAAGAEVEDIAMDRHPEPDIDDDPTGPLDLEGLFREEQKGQIASVGTLLNTRYELVEQLAERHGAETWRAHDQVLSRDVVVHVLAPGDPRSPELLRAARKGAAATDSRFLRVLDADETVDRDQGIGAYVVAEYAFGRSLTDLLSKGPLSAIEAAYIVRELADALVGVHAQGLFHEQITPDNVIITTSGAVRLVGFGIEATLARGDAEDTAWSTRERADVVALGSLLYATLVRHWPGGAAWDLPAAPIIAGETAPAHTVQVGISPALDRICSATLTERGDLSVPRILSASQLVAALDEVLGSADASLDLEQRVRSWHGLDDVPPRPALFRETEVIRRSDDAVAAPPTVTLPAASDDDSLFGFGRESRQDEAPVREGARPGRNGRLWWILLALAVIGLAIALVFSLFGGNDPQPANPTTPGGTSAIPVSPGETTPGNGESTVASGPITVAEVTDFDPETDGGNNEEVPDRAANVVDGDPATTWQTMRYLRNPKLGGLKPGVGLLLDLGEPRTVSSVTLTLVGATSVEIRVPKGETPSMRTEADWEIVGADPAANGTATVTLTEPVESQWVLVYFTELPAVEGGFRAEVAEVTLQ
ncbi:murein biosynthesis integral membrane protein MurJ [Tessaracoccus sp. MC1756]|uniref:murein biosynthesis integral membrane protein MurJ n=1 Tax=Tessaracoccus sp. MC1756 TaxID=2760311 RepID=UPI001604032E|nr:murein biosynthesis integral membrane protein MurJ [Tessaracoccus sp. MC1756]